MIAWELVEVSRRAVLNGKITAIHGNVICTVSSVIPQKVRVALARFKLPHDALSRLILGCAPLACPLKL